MSQSELSSICFTGSAEKPVDERRRIYLPAVYTNQLTQRVFHVTRGQDRSLFIYPNEIFVVKAETLNRSIGFRGQPDKEKRLYFLETMAGAHALKCDEQSRICLPQEFLDYADIKDKALIIGGVDKLILMNPDIYRTLLQASESTEEERVHRYGWGEEPGLDGPE